ncbi:flavin reductase family protein [Chloroflexota bacterium]
MDKVILGPQTLVYPMPTFLVGANVDGQPNFMAVAWSGIANGNPPMISVAIRPQRYTFKGIRQNMAFSVNVPSVELVKEVDYCGLISGSKVNKTEVCQFDVSYGKLGSAPLIEQCPINLQCTVVHILELGSHFLVIGRIDETYVSQDCLTDGKPDVNRIRPFSYVTAPANQYRTLGETVAQAFSIGKELNIYN